MLIGQQDGAAALFMHKAHSISTDTGGEDVMDDCEYAPRSGFTLAKVPPGVASALRMHTQDVNEETGTGCLPGSSLPPIIHHCGPSRSNHGWLVDDLQAYHVLAGLW